MWRAAAGNTAQNIANPSLDDNNDDDWETDADFEVSTTHLNLGLIR